MKTPVVVGALVVVAFVAGRLSTQAPLDAAARGAAARIPSGNGDVNGDGTIDVTDVIHTCRWLFSDGEAPVPIECPPAGDGRLPSTGQTECYGFLERRGWFSVLCEGPEIPGQDGTYQAGCPSEGSFVDNGDGTLTDTCTGLMWQKQRAPGMYAWRQALQYCEDLTLAGHTDWRLPNLRELRSIVDYGRYSPSIDPAFQGDGAGYWSFSTLVNDPANAWYVRFFVGVVGSRSKTTADYVRAVRTGP